MASDIDIANLALGNIKARSIQSFNEASLEAQVCKQRYNLARQYLLKTNVWNFCRTVQPLAKLVDEPKEWVYAYTYPNDCLDARHIVPNYALSTDRTIFYKFGFDYPEDFNRLKGYDQKAIPFEILLLDGVKIIGCDVDEAYLRYTKDITDVNLFDAQFIEAFAWYLASVIAIPIVGSEKGREMRKDAISIYDGIAREAAATNANERMQERTRQSDLTLERQS